jgi:hypothetical protein
METMNEASVKSACQKAISSTQTHCLRRLNSVDSDHGAKGRNVRQPKTYHAYLMQALETHAFEHCYIVRILGQ